MRKQLLTLGLAAISSAALAQIPPAGVPTNGLYTFNNFNGTLQSHTGFQNLTWGGTEGSYVPGRPGAGQACLLDGTYLTGNEALTMPTGDFTIAGWIKLEGSVPNGTYPTLMEWHESMFLRMLSQQNGTVLAQQGGFSYSSGNWLVAEGGYLASPWTQWTHIAMTLGDNSLKLYQNGIMVSEIGSPGFAISNEPVGLIVGGGTTASAINPIKYLNGAIDDLYIYNRGLSQEEILIIYNSVDCNMGTLTYANGSSVCQGQDFQFFETGPAPDYPGTVRIVPNGGTGGPTAAWQFFVSFPFPLLTIYNTYPDIQGQYDVWVTTAACTSEVVTLDFTPQNDPSCFNCSVGNVLISDGDAFCPNEFIRFTTYGTPSTNFGGIFTYELIPLEGQATGVPVTTVNNPANNFIQFNTSNYELEGLYEVQLKVYYAGEETPCDMASFNITILPETAEGCFCEIGTLLVNDGTVICPGETVTILQAGSVQLPEGRDLRFEIYDYPDFDTYYEQQFPFGAPYTFTHDGSYFGEAVFYVYAGYSGGVGMPPFDLQNRGGISDICGSYEVFVTLAQSTDAECLGVGINDIAGAAISIQPNPTNGLVQLNGISQGAVVDVTDMTGRLLGTHSMDTDNGTIDLTHLPSGLYLLRTAGGVFKIVKD